MSVNNSFTPELCRRCEGRGLEPEGRAAAEMFAYVLVLAVFGLCWFALGVLVGTWLG